MFFCQCFEISLSSPFPPKVPRFLKSLEVFLSPYLRIWMEILHFGFSVKIHFTLETFVAEPKCSYIPVLI